MSRVEDTQKSIDVVYGKLDIDTDVIQATALVEIARSLAVIADKTFEDEKEKIERPVGEWIFEGVRDNGNAQYTCSNCKYGDEHAKTLIVPYCWHCGAKMTKEEN